MDEKRLLHGGDYNPDQWLKYPEIIKQDYEYMKKAHINTVTVNVFSWPMLEPKEGEYHFEWLDEVFEKVHQMGGRIILATPSGGRPQWMSEKYEEVNRVDEFNRRHHHGFRHNHCYSSKIYRQKVKEIDEKLSQRYGKHPALLMWHISNEFSGECYCDQCAQNWRKWVKNKYKTLDALNEAWWSNFWGGTYTNWSQVVPPSPLGETKSHSMDLDWKRFNTEMTIDFFNWEVEAVRKYSDVPVTTNFMAEGQAQGDFIPLEGIDYSLFSKYVDIVSWDSYPDWHNNYEKLWQTAMKTGYIHDVYYSMKEKPFLIMESTPSGVNWAQYNKTKRPGMHILSSIQQIAHGSDSTLYFQWRQSRGNSEKFHGAVVGHDCSCENRVFQEVAAYGQRLEKISEVKGTLKEVKVAIICDWQSNWALKRGGGYGRPTRRYMQTLQDHYAVFWKNDISVNIVGVDADLSQYRLVIAPMLYMMNEETMKKLQEYTHQGGILVSSYFTGFVNETDLLYIGGWPDPLKKLFGIETKELETLLPQEHNHIVYHQKEYKTKDYCSIIKPLTAKILSTYLDDFYANTPSLTVNSYGEGLAYYIAARTDIDFLEAFYHPLIEKLSLKNNVFINESEEVSIQTRISEDTQYYFVMNFSTNKHRVILNKPLLNVENKMMITDYLDLEVYDVYILKEVDK